MNDLVDALLAECEKFVLEVQIGTGEGDTLQLLGAVGPVVRTRRELILNNSLISARVEFDRGTSLAEIEEYAFDEENNPSRIPQRLSP
jgi:hypothetical protein